MNSISLNEWSTGQLDDFAQSLERNIVGGIVLEEYEDGSVLRVAMEHKVGASGSLIFEIFSNEHPPPHFRVSYQGETANFTIKDCKKISGKLNFYEKNIRYWHKDNKEQLI